MSEQDKPPDKPPIVAKPRRKHRKVHTQRRQLSKDEVTELLSDDAFKAPGETTEDVCKRYGVSTKSLQRWKKRVAADSALSAEVANKKAGRAQGWKDSRIRFLRNAIDKLEQLVAKADVTQMRDVAGAIKIVGDLEGMASALGVESDVEQPVRNQPGQVSEEAASRDGGAAETDEPDPVH